MKNIILTLSFFICFASANAQWIVQSPHLSANAGVSFSNSSTGNINIGLSSCNGCYSGQAKPNDGVIRVLGGGDLILNIPASTPDNRGITFAADFSKLMQIKSTGSVIVGNPTLIPAGYKLYVETGIITEKVKVALVNNWADYVFDKKYTLLPLKEVEKYILSNKHLPNVPSAEQVAKEGIDMAMMDAKLLEKIEELTLYIIQLNKKVDVLEKVNKNVKNRNHE
jgi:hypothetical protein